MKKLLLSLYLITFCVFYGNADTYDAAKVYNNGDETTITINGTLITIVYIGSSASSNFNPSTPYDVNNGWLWSVSKNYTGEWVAYHYMLYTSKPTTVTYSGHTYVLLQELWSSAPSPDIAANDKWGWNCTNCTASSITSCPNSYSTDYFPIFTAQTNNGKDGSSPINNTGNSTIITSNGNTFMNINQIRACVTPLVLYNNDIYLRDGCDPHEGLGYYGIAGNTNVPVPQKRLFADQNIDGPVLYGFSGGALGVRQRTDRDVVNGPHIEKVALQWTPNSVLVGTTKLPMNFIVNGTGRVGIGTSSPQSLLQVGEDINSNLHSNIPNGVVITSNVGNVASDRAILELHSPKAVNVLDIETLEYGTYIGNMGPNPKPLHIQQQGGYVGIGDEAYSCALAVSGNVGIGTAPKASYKLAVNGGIVATSMDIMNPVPASDYVFEKDYKLRTLKETETYVNKNKHLPEVPSAEEFKKNGYSVGTMDDILLRKVEELTLYMIELQKQNEAIQKQNDALKAKVEKLEKQNR
jgi:hypothetical protein